MKTVRRYSIQVEVRTASSWVERKIPEQARAPQRNGERRRDHAGVWLLTLAILALAAWGAHITVVLAP